MTSQITWVDAYVTKKVAILHGKMLHLCFHGYGKTIPNASTVATLPDTMVPRSVFDGWYLSAGRYVAGGVAKIAAIATSSSNLTISVANDAADSMQNGFFEIIVELS